MMKDPYDDEEDGVSFGYRRSGRRRRRSRISRTRREYMENDMMGYLRKNGNLLCYAS